MSILLVDDSLVQRLALAEMLALAGYEDVLMAGSGLEALALVMSQGEMIDLILMDLHMPELDGIKTCAEIKGINGREDIPIIMVTSSDESADLQLAFAAGAMDYITKPPNEIELVARVRSALRLKRETDYRKAREQELVLVNGRLENVLTSLAEKHSMLQLEQEKSERLLLNILPQTVAEQLKQQPGIIAERFEEVTVLFADIVNFTQLSARISPEKLVQLLNEIFSRFDKLADQYHLEKIKTIGDAYMAVAGLPMPHADHAQAAAEMALALQRELSNFVLPGINEQLQVRIGLHTGPVVAGVIGQKKFSYDLWGDTVNTASRMESQGIAGGIQVTAETYTHLQKVYRFEKRGSIAIKGKGEIETYWLLEKKGCCEEYRAYSHETLVLGELN